MGTFCQLCGLPTQHDHYVPSRGMFKIYRGARPDGGHVWEAGEKPFPFAPGHAWLKDAVVLPWDREQVIRGAIEDGGIEAGDGDGVLVMDGGDDGLAFHHACWTLQGSPPSTGPSIRANYTHGWALVMGYQEQLFDFEALAADGKAWMLADPTTDERSRRRIQAMLEISRDDIGEPPADLPRLLQVDRDWNTQTLYDQKNARRGIVRARMHALEKVPKDGYDSLVRVVRTYGGSGLPGAGLAALEEDEAALKAAVEKGAQAVLAVVGIGRGRAEYLVYARDAAKTRALLPLPAGAEVQVSKDPDWGEAFGLIQSFR